MLWAPRRETPGIRRPERGAETTTQKNKDDEKNTPHSPRPKNNYTTTNSFLAPQRPESFKKAPGSPQRPKRRFSAWKGEPGPIRGCRKPFWRIRAADGPKRRFSACKGDPGPVRGCRKPFWRIRAADGPKRRFSACKGDPGPVRGCRKPFWRIRAADRPKREAFLKNPGHWRSKKEIVGLFVFVVRLET